MRVRLARFGVSLSIAAVLALAGSPAPAAEPKAPAAAGAATPQPAQVLAAMSAFLQKQKAFSYHAELDFDQLLPNGPMVRLSGAVDVVVARPGSLHVDYRDDVSDRVAWLDGGVFTLLDPVAVTYARVTGPRDIDGMLAKLEQAYGTTLPLGDLAESDPAAALTRGVDLAHYVGVHNVDGVMCHHVVLQRKDLDAQVFVEVGERPLVRKLVFTDLARAGTPQYTAWLTEWKLGPPQPGIFAPKLPKGAAQVEFLPLRGDR